MLLISHRGNVSGRNPERENTKEYIEEALSLGFYVEVDLWVDHGKFYLAHTYQGIGGCADVVFYSFKNPPISPSFLTKERLLIHCKNIDALKVCIDSGGLNYFYHEKDKLTISSHGWIIAHSDNKPIGNTIHMLPEIKGYSKDSLKDCAGICSDIIEFYK
ncbi:MAG: hypothetical protein FMNOHCHN_03393 [Ignavibacteriaceae bacterium]|nr:hypothetical protein [Ignavibacteriaceae bacterium]